MRPSQQVRKSLLAPEVILHLQYWEDLKQQLFSDLIPLIEEKAKASMKPPKGDLLQMDPEQASKILYWSHRNLKEANTLYAAKEFIDKVLDASYRAVLGLNVEYHRRLSIVGSEARDWKSMFFREQESCQVSNELAVKAMQELIELKNANKPAAL